ncbi:MAG: Rieske (2Fe-2S) protein, partial [Bacteroidota bacterium]
MTRKDFLKNVGAAALLVSLGVSLESCSSADDDEITPTPTPDDDDDTEDGGDESGNEGITFSLSESPFDTLQTFDAWLLHPDENILLANVNGTIRAFTSVCTHSGCSRSWQFDNARARCTCHNSIFDQDGSRVSGPATRAL